PVTVLEAQGSNGIYSGTGYIVVPYLADTKVKVSFNNIKLNTDRKLIEGVIETTYDPTEKNIVNVGDILNDLGNLIDGIVKIIDDAIGNDGMSQSDYDKLFDDVNNLIGKNNQDTSSLYDQGLITPKLKKEIEDLEQKIKDELKDLTCAVKDDKKKGSDDVAETDCIQKLKNLKADIEELKSKNAEKDEMRCIWNIAPNENLKGKTYYFQISEKNNDGEGKKLYKLKEGDYPISFNKNKAVYTFKSKGKIYRPFSDNSYYFSNTSEDKYVFETGDGKSLVDIKIDDNNANAVTINGVQITAQQDCTDAKERGKGLSENLVFSTVVKGKYSISIEQDGKGKFISTFKLLGKGNSKISDSQKTGIEQEVQNSINTVLKDLKDPKDLNSLSNKTEVTDFGFYVKQMTGKEWIETLSDLGTTVWEEASLPKNYWNEDEAGYTNSTIRMPALFTGVADGGINLVSDYPQLVKLGYDVATNVEFRKQLWDGVKSIDADKVINFAEEEIKRKWENYNFSDKPYMGNHELGKDGVGVVKFATGAGALVRGIKEAGEKFEKASIKTVINSVKDFVEDVVKKRGNIRKVLDIPEGEAYARKYFERVVKEGNFEDWWKEAKKWEKGGDLNFEVHHVIPIKVFENNPKLQEVLLWAEQNGKKFDFNSIDNGIPLQKKKAAIELNGHTNHPKYDDAITEKLQKITSSSLSEEKKFESIKSLIEKTKNKLENEVLLGSKDVNQIVDL
ncbi:AHH domain-containing protein, partial [Riemerella anatipestifer]|nr:AHH domain-containing protein [Riemerella anatipestifer]